jgi:DNA transformation protein
MASKRGSETFRALPRDALRDWLEEALAPLPDLSIRRMFGGAGIYADDTMFGILHEQRMYLKTDERTRGDFVARGSGAFRVRSGSVLTSYYELPVDVLDDESELLRWSQTALGVAREAQQRPRGRRFVEPEQILAEHTAEIRKLAERARAIVREEAPQASEAGYPGWRLIGYRAPHYFCFVAPLPEHVRVGFEHGHALPDPKGLLEPMGKQVRFVRLEPGKRIPEAALRELIRAALELRPAPRAPKKQRSQPKRAARATRRAREP